MKKETFAQEKNDKKKHNCLKIRLESALFDDRQRVSLEHRGSFWWKLLIQSMPFVIVVRDQNAAELATHPDISEKKMVDKKQSLNVWSNEQHS